MKRNIFPFLFLVVTALILWSAKPSRVTVTLGGQVKVLTGDVTHTQACAFVERVADDCSNPQNPGPDGYFRIQFEAIENGAAYVEFRQEGYTTVRRNLEKELSNRDKTIFLKEAIHLVRLDPDAKINKLTGLKNNVSAAIPVYDNAQLENHTLVPVPDIQYFRNIRPVEAREFHQEDNANCRLLSGYVYQTRLKLADKSKEEPETFFLFELHRSQPCGQHIATKE